MARPDPFDRDEARELLLVAIERRGGFVHVAARLAPGTSATELRRWVERGSSVVALLLAVERLPVIR